MEIPDILSFSLKLHLRQCLSRGRPKILFKKLRCRFLRKFFASYVSASSQESAYIITGETEIKMISAVPKHEFSETAS